jgi:hypothetical protein
LYLSLEKEFDVQKIPKIMSALTKNAEKFIWLEPPVPNGTITVLDVVKSENATEHQEIVKNWAANVWNAWQEHHPKIKQIAAEYLS